MKTKEKSPFPPKGMRDFNSAQVLYRQYIIRVIQQVFEKYLFLPLETPALEYLSTLTGKYGQEGEKLIFKVLKSGDFLADFENNGWPSKGINYKNLLPIIADKGLRYDLTVPMMRYIAHHYQEITFPFKRYQVQPVWRADRPQKGRYREFLQCDADVIGSTSLVFEAELLNIIYEVFQTLGLQNKYTIHLNHRAILNGLVDQISCMDQVHDFCMTIDKLDKVGQEKVIEELLARGFPNEGIEKIKFIFDLSSDNQELTISTLKHRLQDSEIGLAGIEALAEIITYLKAMRVFDQLPLVIDPCLARGLTYYTGAIYEIKCTAIPMGSLAGGGRYDILSENFGLTKMPGTGLSFGIDRIYEVLAALDCFPKDIDYPRPVVLLATLDQISMLSALKLRHQMHKKNILVEIYPLPEKLKKQLSYAHKKSIPFVAIMGEEERKAGKVILREMSHGKQFIYTEKEMIDFLANVVI